MMASISNNNIDNNNTNYNNSIDDDDEDGVVEIELQSSLTSTSMSSSTLHRYQAINNNNNNNNGINNGIDYIDNVDNNTIITSRVDNNNNDNSNKGCLGRCCGCFTCFTCCNCVNCLGKKHSSISIVLSSLLALLFIALIASLCYVYTLANASAQQSNLNQMQVMSLNTQLMELQSQLISLTTQVVDLQSLNQQYTQFQQQQNASQWSLEQQVHVISGQIDKISNHSNAQVLTQFQEMQSQLQAQMTNTQLNINKELNFTMQQMQHVYVLATQNIYQVQHNVSEELNLMSQQLSLTVENLNADVQSAEESINAQVEDMKDTMSTYMLVADKQFAAENDFVRFQLAGTFTLLGCLISLWHITSHLRHLYNPDVQRRVMAVLWMVPIYGVTSWLSLVFPQAESVFGTVRDIYESYVVYTFIGLLIAVLEERKGTAHLLSKLRTHIIAERIADEEAIAAGTRRPSIHLVPACASCDCCYNKLRASSVAEYWLFQCRLFTMQFVFFKPFFALLPALLALVGYNYDKVLAFENNHINWASAKIYVILLQNISVGLAFYGLLKFYHGTEQELAWCDPWPKFLCIKGVVFMTFWQGFAITIMSNFGYLDAKSASQIQNLLICIEMLLASLAHYYIFPYYEWEEGYKKEHEDKKIRIADTLAVRDFYRDATSLFGRRRSSLPADTPDSSHGDLLEGTNHGQYQDIEGGYQAQDDSVENVLHRKQNRHHATNTDVSSSAILEEEDDDVVYASQPEALRDVDSVILINASLKRELSSQGLEAQSARGSTLSPIHAIPPPSSTASPRPSSIGMQPESPSLIHFDDNHVNVGGSSKEDSIEMTENVSV